MRVSLRVAFVVLALWHCAAAAQGPSPATPRLTNDSAHSQFITSLAISPDDSLIVTGSYDHTLKLWDRKTGFLLRTLAGHTDSVDWVGVTPDSRLIVSISHDSVFVWDASTGAVVRSIDKNDRRLDASIFGVGALSGDGKSVYFTKFRTLYKVDIATGAIVRKYTGESFAKVALSPDQKILAVSSNVENSNRYSLSLIDAASGRRIRELDRRDYMESLTFSPDGRLFLVVGTDSVARVWEVATGKLLYVLRHTERTDPGYLRGIAFSRDGRSVVTSGDHGLKYWDAATGALVRSVNDDELTGPLVLSHRGDLLALARSGKVELREATHGAAVPPTFGDAGRPVGVSVLSERTWVSAGSSGLTVWDADTMAPVQHFPQAEMWKQVFTVDRDKPHLVAHALKSKLLVQDARTGATISTIEWGPCAKCKEEYQSHFNNLHAISPDGKYVAAVLFTDPSTLKVWDTATGAVVHTLVTPTDEIKRNKVLWPQAVAFSADSRSVLVADDVHSFTGARRNPHPIRVWDVASGRAAPTLFLAHEDRYRLEGDLLVPSPDGRYLAVRSFPYGEKAADGLVLVALVEARSGRLVRSFKATGVIGAAIGDDVSARFSTDSRHIFVASNNQIVQFETETGRQIRTFVSPGTPNSLTISDDGRRLVVGTQNSEIVVWDIASGNRLAITVQTETGDWLTVTPEGFFNASERGARLLHLVNGLEATGIDQLYQALFRPDLVREKLRGDPKGRVRAAAANIDLTKVVASGRAPDVNFVRPDGGSGGAVDSTAMSVEVEVVDRGGGVGRVEWRLNGITVGIDTPAITAQAIRLTRSLVLDDGANRVEVVAYNGADLVASVPARVEVTVTARPRPDTTVAATKPRLLAIVAGIDKYADERFDLDLAVSDATEVARSLRVAAGDLYRSTEVKLITDTGVSRDGLDAAFAEISGKAEPGDVFVLYLAGHGKTVNGRYYFVPHEFRIAGEASDDAVEAAVVASAISQEQWQRWFAAIPARRSVILFDTCDSGTLVGDETRDLERESANDRLAQATGRSILAASGGNQEALEGYRGHGLFTYGVLDAINRADGDGSGTVEVSELAAYVYAQVSELSQTVFKRRQVPQMKIASSYPLVRQTVVLPDQSIPIAAGKGTYVLAQTADLQIRPTPGATVVRSLTAKTAVTVVEDRDGWALIAAEGRPLGWVATRSLTPRP